MNIEDLRKEAAKLGYKLQKMPDWNCQCIISYEMRLKETKGHQYCKKAEFKGYSIHGYTHCYREKRKSNE